MRQSDIKRLKAVEAMMETLPESVYDRLLDNGCRPMTVAALIRDIIKTA